MTIKQSDLPIRILLVEDDPGDVLLVREALSESGESKVEVASNGEQALAHLHDLHPSDHPDLILLDLNLPRLGGLDVLEKIKRDENLRSIPVVVLTTSCAETDVESSYRLHANAYVCKPAEVDRFLVAVRLISEFFVRIVRLPVR